MQLGIQYLVGARYIVTHSCLLPVREHVGYVDRQLMFKYSVYFFLNSITSLDVTFY